MLQKLSENFDSDKSLSTLEYFKRKKKYIHPSAYSNWSIIEHENMYLV